MRNPWNDLDILRTHIVAANQPLFIRQDLSDNITIIKCLPKRWHSMMKLIADVYNVKIKIVNKLKLDSAAFYNPTDRIISLLSDKGSLKGGWSVWERNELMRTFFHEIAHAIQYNVVTNVGHFDRMTFLAYYLFERAAERLAYYLWKAYMSNWYTHHAQYKGYMDKSHKEILRKRWLKDSV